MLDTWFQSRVLIFRIPGYFYIFKDSVVNGKLGVVQVASPGTLSSLILVKENFQLTVAVRLMPPLSFFLKPILGGLLFRRIPNPSSSFSIIFLWPRGFSTSRTIRIRLQVRATTNWKKKIIPQKSPLTQSETKQCKIWLSGLMTMLKPWRPIHCSFLNSSIRLKFVVLTKHHW